MSNKAAARKLIELLMRQTAELDSFLIDIRATCNESEFTKYKKMVGRIMGSMLLDGINVLSDEFPDLKPKELDDPPGSGTS